MERRVNRKVAAFLNHKVYLNNMGTRGRQFCKIRGLIEVALKSLKIVMSHRKMPYVLRRLWDECRIINCGLKQQTVL